MLCVRSRHTPTRIHRTHLTSYIFFVFGQKKCQELEAFIERSNEILTLAFEWDDSSSLLRVLNVLNQIKVYESSIINLFPSLKKIVYMIMQYDIKIPKRCLNQVNKIVYNPFSECQFTGSMTRYFLGTLFLTPFLSFILNGMATTVFTVFGFTGEMGRFTENRIDN